MARIRGLLGLFGHRNATAVRYAGENDETYGEPKFAFGIVKQPVYLADPEVSSFHGPRYSAIPKRYVLRRDDTMAPLAVVSDRYFPVTHGEVITALDKRFMEQGATFERKVALLNGGCRMMVEYQFPDVSVEVAPGDRVNLTLLGGNSFDLSTSLWMRVGAFRLICTNGAMIGKILAFVKRRHTDGLDLSRIAADLSQAAAAFTEGSERWRMYAQTPFSVGQAAALLAAIREQGRTALTEKQETAILTEFGNPRWGRGLGNADFTLWGFYNAITAVASHDARGEAPVFNLLNQANLLTEEALVA